MKFKIFFNIILLFLFSFAVNAADPEYIRNTISLDDYIVEIKKSLPELKSNEMDILSAENKVKSAKSAADIYLNAGGTAYSNKEYSGIADSGDVKGYNYYAGLSKKFTSTGTELSTSYNYSKGSYNNFSLTSDYSSCEPSVTVKVTQPLLYNFLGKVNRYSEKNAVMQLAIANYQLEENNKSLLNVYKKLYFQWILYNEYIKNLTQAVKNSNILKEQTRRKLNAGLADNDDYQSSLASVLSYENQRIEYLTALKKIETQLIVYMDINARVPDVAVFDEYLIKVSDNELAEVDFRKTTSAKIMDLTMKNYAYSQGVYENKLLPEFNVFSEITKKGLSDSQTYSLKDTDYNIGFEFKYYIENNSAESDLKDIEIKIKSLEYEYRSTENTFRKNLLGYIEAVKGIIDQLSVKEKTLTALQSRLVTEKKKYNQARLNLSYIIDTENNITSEKNNILSLRYQLIGYYLDYLDLIQ